MLQARVGWAYSPTIRRSWWASTPTLHYFLLIPYTRRMPRNLKDMVVIITGASAGIGRALAEELAPHGAKLTLAARRLDRLEELKGKLPRDPLILATDVSKEEEC